MLEPPPTWFHGGVPGLEPGDLILPPSESGILTVGEVVKRFDKAAWERSAHAREDPLLVSITPDLTDATYYAALWSICPWRPGHGCVYRVAAESTPVRAPHQSEWRCGQAAVLEVVTPDGVTAARGRALPGKWGFWVAETERHWELARLLGWPLPARGRVVARHRDPGAG